MWAGTGGGQPGRSTHPCLPGLLGAGPARDVPRRALGSGRTRRGLGQGGEGEGRGGRYGRDEWAQGTAASSTWGVQFKSRDFSLETGAGRTSLRSSIPAPPSWLYLFLVAASTPPPAPPVLWGAHPLVGCVTCKWLLNLRGPQSHLNGVQKQAPRSIGLRVHPSCRRLALSPSPDQPVAAPGALLLPARPRSPFTPCSSQPSRSSGPLATRRAPAIRCLPALPVSARSLSQAAGSCTR